MRLFRRAIACLVLAFGAASPTLADNMHIDVTVSYRERIALPPDAVVEIELLDTSLADAPSVRLSSQMFKMDSVPFSTRLPYDPTLIDERMSYTVAANILSDRQVIFRSTSAFPVLTRGAGSSVDLVLQRMPASQSAATASLFDIQWVAHEIGGRALIAENPPTITFQPDGAFGLYAGCNRFAGKADIADNQIVFPEQFAGTLMACPEARENLERDMMNAINASTRYTISGNNLALSNDAGVTVVRFQHQGN